MTGRLQNIINLISPDSSGVIDVGTDHGYVPVTLAQIGYGGRIIATDINSEPLGAAKRYAAAQGVSDLIEFRLTDGLTGCTPKEADTVIIAGMGGDLICSILDSAEDFFRGGVRLILQPMTRPEVLRYYLISKGWRITDEVPVKENGRIFQLFSACYQGMFMRLGNYQDPSLKDWELFTGAYTLISSSPLFDCLLGSEAEKIRKKLLGTDRLFYRSILNDLENARQMFSHSNGITGITGA